MFRSASVLLAQPGLWFLEDFEGPGEEGNGHGPRIPTETTGFSLRFSEGMVGGGEGKEGGGLWSAALQCGLILQGPESLPTLLFPVTPPPSRGLQSSCLSCSSPWLA